MLYDLMTNKNFIELKTYIKAVLLKKIKQISKDTGDNPKALVLNKLDFNLFKVFCCDDFTYDNENAKIIINKSHIGYYEGIKVYKVDNRESCFIDINSIKHIIKLES